MSPRTWGGHRDSFLLPERGRRPAVAVAGVRVAGVAGVADEGEEDVLEGGLLLDVLDLGGRARSF